MAFHQRKREHETRAYIEQSLQRWVLRRGCGVGEWGDFHTRPHLDDADAARFTVTLEKRGRCKEFGHRLGQQFVRMLARLPDSIG